QFLYDGGIHIPLIVRFPDGRDAGKVDDRFVSAVDYLPTMLGFAGVRMPAASTQGQDIFGPEYKAREYVFALRDRMDISTDRMRAVRTKQFKYIRNYYPMIPYMQHNPYKEENYPTWNLVTHLNKQGKLNREQALFAAEAKPVEELFDLQADPDEVHNL